MFLARAKVAAVACALKGDHTGPCIFSGQPPWAFLNVSNMDAKSPCVPGHPMGAGLDVTSHSR